MYSNPLDLTHWWVLLVQFFLLREQIQTLPQRDLPGRAPLWDWQGQITENIERVGVVRAHRAMQRAPQLAWEQVCEKGRKKYQQLPSLNLLCRLDWWTMAGFALLTYYSAVVSLQVLLPHGSCLFRDPKQGWKMEGKKGKTESGHMEEHKSFKDWISFHINTPKSGVFLFGLLPCSPNVGSAVDFCVQLVQQEPEELLCILLTGFKR